MSSSQILDSDFPIDPSSLPPTWTIALIRDVVDNVRAGFSSGERSNMTDGIPHLRPMNIDRRGRITLDQLEYVPQVSDLRVVRGDVLFNNTNSPELVGKTAPIDLDGEWGFSNHMTRLRPSDGISYRFLAHQLHYLWQEGYFRLRCTQHVNQASIAARTLTQTVPVAVAPSTQQLQVAAELDRYTSQLDAAKAALDSALRRVEEYGHRVLRRAAAGQLVSTQSKLARAAGQQYETGAQLLERLNEESRERLEAKDQLPLESLGLPPTEGWKKRYRPFLPVDPTKLPPLPDGWVWARVSEVGEVTLGRQRAPKYHYGPHMRPYLRVANVFEDRIDSSDIHEMNFSPEEYVKYKLNWGDILLNEGQSPDLVGRSAMYRDEVPGACFQNTLIRFRAYPGVSPSFALIVFRDYLHSSRFRREAQWSTNIAHLGEKRFANMEFPLPPLAEQERIAAEARTRLESASELTEVIRGIRDRIDRVRFIAYRRAFTGELSDRHSIVDEPSATALMDQIRRYRETSEPQRAVQKDVVPRRIKEMQRRSLTTVLTEEDRRLTPEELLVMSGLSEEWIDEFYAELRREVMAGRISEYRDGGQSYLAMTSIDA